MKQKKLLWVMGIGALAFVIYFFDIPCPILTTLGIPCPGCGITRAFRALFAGKIGDSFFYYPLWPLALFVFIIWFLGKQSWVQIKWVNWIMKKDAFWYSCLAVVLIVYIIRMIWLFPDVIPMQSNPNGILIRLYHWIRP